MYRALKNLMIAIVMLAAAPAFAGGPTVTVGSDSGLPSAVVVIPVNYAGSPADIAGLDIDVFFPTGQFSSVTVNCGAQTVGATNTFCSNAAAGSGRVDVILARIGGGTFTDGKLADITFTIAGGATPGAKELNGVTVGVSNEAGTDLPTNTITMIDGTLTVLGPDADFAPNPGLLDLGSVQQGGTDPTDNVTIDNVGAATTTLTGTCSESNDTGNAFTLSGDTSFSVPEAGPNDTVTVTCESNLAPDTYTATMTCTHNGDGTTDDSPAIFNLSCTVTPGPAPAYSSNPAAGSTLNFGTVPKNDPDPELTVDISNSGDADTTLTGTCTIPTNPSNAYSIVGSAAFSVLQGSPADTITVACDTAVPGTHNGGTLSCSHNGSNPSPATYTLNCTIPPEPSIATTPNPNPLNFGPVPQNNTDPTGTLTIDNDGDPGSQLAGACSLAGGPGVITIQSGSGSYTVNEAGPNHVVTVRCESSSTPGVYNNTLECTHNEIGVTSPVTFPVNCTIGQPDPAQYDSTPAPSAKINITQGLDVVVGDPDPTKPLEIRNEAPAGDADMNVSCQLVDVEGTAITASPPVSDLILGPGEDEDITFTCDTTNANAEGTPFEATYTCEWFSVLVPELETESGTGTQQPVQETYTVNCEVRDAESDVDPQTASGTTHTQLIQPGGSAQFSFTFDEVMDEGVDGSLECTLDTGADFSILSPSFPATVPAGGSVTVVVEGTDPGGVQSIQDVLRCTYFDSQTGEPGAEVFYNLVLLIGGNASFAVDKVFTDGNPGDVTVTISCNTGLPLEQSKVISQGDGVKFIVGDFDSGEMDCEVTEEPVNGYSGDFDASNSASDFDDEGAACEYFDITGGDDNFCVITNSPDPVDVEITKEWVIEGTATEVDMRYDLTLYCDSEIVGGSQPCLIGPPIELQEAGATFNDAWCTNFAGDGPDSFTAQVIPAYPYTHCHVVESVYESGVETDNGCQYLEVSAGNGASCTITNTVFFEGIPTLSQYGLAILALLTLGIGLVGFRRFT